MLDNKGEENDEMGKGLSTLLRRFTTYKEDLGQAIWPKFEFSVEWISPTRDVKYIPV